MSFMQINDLKVHYPIRGGFFNTVVDQCACCRWNYLNLKKEKHMD